MKNTRKNRINENNLRSLIRKEITRIMEVDEEEQVPVEEPVEEPEVEEPEIDQEEGLDPKLQAINSMYIKRLKDAPVSVGTEELVTMLSEVIERFNFTSEQKLSILKGIKSNTIR